MTEVDNLDLGAVADKDPLRSAPNQAPKGESGFVDGSGPIFSMYLGMAEEEDKDLAESWKADAEGILVFTGLFSAAVASLISVSIQDLQQNPQDTSNFYLANIYQALADPNRSNISTLPASPPPFYPPTFAVWVNSLWFLSLVISITCALLATLLQQWARRYLKATHTRYTLHKRARFRSFFSEGVEKSLLPLAVDALPTMLHLSLFLFFAGLAVFVRNVNLTIFKVVLSWIAVCTALYGCITLVPVFRRDSPYYTPLTPLARPVVAVILCLFFFPCVTVGGFLFLFSLFSCCLGPYRILGYLINWFIYIWEITFETPEEAVLRTPSEIDTRALMWTFGRLDEDHELVHFFSSLPGFHGSKVLKEPLRGLKDDKKLQLLAAIVGLLDRTFSSDLLPDLKSQRVDICVTAINLVYTPKAFPDIVRRLASEDGYGPVNSTDIVRFIKRWDDGKDEGSVVQGMFSIVVARVQRHDDSWFALASKELVIAEAVLREHATRGDSLSLAILIHITRQQFIHFGNTSWPLDAIASVLEAASKFNAQDTSAELQHEFCALWNEIVRKAQEDSEWKIANGMLRRIRKVYLALHHDTNSAPTRFDASTGEQDELLDVPPSYPICNVVGHILEKSTSTTITLAAQHDNAVWPPPSFPSPSAPFNVDESLTTVPPPDNSNPAESFSVAVTSLDQATAGGVQDTVASGITIPTPETFPLSVVSRQRPLMPSDSPILSSSAPNQVLGDILPTGSHHSITAITLPGASPGMTFAPDRDAAAEDDASPMPTLRKETNALGPPSTNHANTTAILDPSPHSPPLRSVIEPEVALTSPSLREPNVQPTADCTPDPSRYRYNIV